MTEWILAAALWCSVNAGSGHGWETSRTMWVDKKDCQTRVLKCVLERKAADKPEELAKYCFVMGATK